MQSILLVILGGGLGAGARHLVGLATLRLFGPGFPVGTLAVNILGSLAMGLFIGWMAKSDMGGLQSLRLFFATGLLGGFTTFSSFSLDTAFLWQRGETVLAMGYVLGSVVLSISAVFAGLMIMRHTLS